MNFPKNTSYTQFTKPALDTKSDSKVKDLNLLEDEIHEFIFLLDNVVVAYKQSEFAHSADNLVIRKPLSKLISSFTNTKRYVDKASSTAQLINYHMGIDFSSCDFATKLELIAFVESPFISFNYVGSKKIDFSTKVKFDSFRYSIISKAWKDCESKEDFYAVLKNANRVKDPIVLLYDAKDVCGCSLNDWCSQCVDDEWKFNKNGKLDNMSSFMHLLTTSTIDNSVPISVLFDIFIDNKEDVLNENQSYYVETIRDMDSAIRISTVQDVEKIVSFYRAL